MSGWIKVETIRGDGSGTPEAPRRRGLEIPANQRSRI
jgi:hypothetical protein